MASDCHLVRNKGNPACIDVAGLMNDDTSSGRENPKAVARVDSPFGGTVGGDNVSATRLVKKLDMRVCFP